MRDSSCLEQCKSSMGACCHCAKATTSSTAADDLELLSHDDAQAQFALAASRQGDAEAEERLNRVARQGHPFAMVELGLRELDEAFAFKWLELAARHVRSPVAKI